MRTVHAVRGNSQKLDGGAMFGNAPKTVWERLAPPDAHNRIDLACRAMLVKEERRTILCETGIGAFFEPKLRERFGVVESQHVLLDSLAALGAPHEAIDIVVLSHLHFDHAGGLLAEYEEGARPRLLFPNAIFLVGAKAFDRAKNPHARDRASFIEELPALLESSGRLKTFEGERSDVLGNGYRFHGSDGHTPGLSLLEVEMADGPIVFAGDLVPGTAWVHQPMTMGYDRFPELLIDEKRALYEAIAPRDGRLFFTHDPQVRVAAVERDPRGRWLPVRQVTDDQPILR